MGEKWAGTDLWAFSFCSWTKYDVITSYNIAPSKNTSQLGINIVMELAVIVYDNEMTTLLCRTSITNPKINTKSHLAIKITYHRGFRAHTTGGKSGFSKHIFDSHTTQIDIFKLDFIM